MVQMLSDPAPLLGRSIAYERLVGSQLIQEDEPFAENDQDTAAAASAVDALRAHPKAPYLRLVVSQDRPAFLNFGSGDLLQQMVRGSSSRWRAANSEEDSRLI